ncbi:MAG: metallophosphoesterase [Candidatus Fournierella pullistercoris]|uniref:Metallophosphoesterase n=1 Tax=Candidatus Allofournierella pullistercoris TaxID=2838597 RepID=A0A948T3B7_9FIRM|nr:metallophosphoesterase [Candidatus Fournierella pullistercoris]
MKQALKTPRHKKPAILALVAVLAVLIGWIFWTNTHFTTSYFTITNPAIPADFHGYKIAAVSDLHNQDWNGKLAAKLQAEAPDLIAITGDLVDSSHTNLDVAMEFIEEIRDIAPIYYVTGNHEAWLAEYDQLAGLLRDAGVQMMDDQTHLIQRGNASINLVGIQDPDFTQSTLIDSLPGSIVGEKLESLLRDDLYNVVLCHRPELFDQYVALDADLVLTGHAHGGQISIPFIGGLIAPNQGLFPKYTQGLHHKNNTDMIVSRGLGNSVLPVRINNTPELVIVTLGE